MTGIRTTAPEVENLSQIKGDKYEDAVLAFVVTIHKINISASAKL